MEDERLEHRASLTAKVVTLSLGAASVFPGSSSSPDRLIADADAALYRAKQTGRNRVVLKGEGSIGIQGSE